MSTGPTSPPHHVHRRSRATAAVLAALLLPQVGCASAAPGATGPAAGTTLTVLAAASLTESFTELGEEFERAHPGVSVRFTFAGSATLARQVVEGAPADVLATADTATMRRVAAEGGLEGEPVVFARNTLVIAVAPGNPAGITSARDLARPGVRVALCEQRVPCGAAATRALAAAGVRVTPVTLEQDVRAVLTKLRLGEVDAALVYRTDVRAAGDEVTGVELAPAARVVNDYPAAVVAGAPHPGTAREFVAYLGGERAERVLVEAGFAPA